MESREGKILQNIYPSILQIIENNIPPRSDEFDWIINHPKVYHDPFLLPDIQKALRLLRRALSNRQKIALFGDKDVDGITALATLARFFDSLNQSNPDSSGGKFSYIILSEESENADYGLTEKIVNEALENNCGLLVALDTGTSDFEAISYAREKGMDVLVIDHHEPKEELPEASALVNPKRKESVYPFSGLATAGLVLKICHAFLISFAKPTVFVWLEGQGLRIEFRKSDEILSFGSLEELKGLLESEEKNISIDEIRWIAASEDIQKKIETEIPLKLNINTWNYFREKFESFEKNRDRKNPSGIDIWGNPLTNFSGKDILENMFENLINQEMAVSLPRAFQILQMTISEKIYNRLFIMLPLVAIGTLADMMPLEDENRIFVRSGMMLIRKGLDKTLRLLIDRLGIFESNIRSRTISWSMIPVLNSPGRLGSGKETLDYFLRKEATTQIQSLEALLDKNRQRRELVEVAKKKVIEIAEKEKETRSGKIIIGLLKDFPFGITGLVATRVAEYFEKPSVVLVQNGEKIIGSARSFGGVDVLDMVASAKDHLALYGGHKEAAGFSFNQSNYSPVTEAFTKFSRQFDLSAQKNGLPGRTGDEFIQVNVDDINHIFLKQLDWLEPFGMGNREPIFLIKEIPPFNFKTMGKDRSHGKFSFVNKLHLTKRDFEESLFGKGDESPVSAIEKSSFHKSKGNDYVINSMIEVIGWGMAEEMRVLAERENKFDATGELDVNFFRGELKLNIVLNNIIN